MVLATLLREHFIRQKNPIFVAPAEEGDKGREGRERKTEKERGKERERESERWVREDSEGEVRWDEKKKFLNLANSYTNLLIVVLISCDTPLSIAGSLATWLLFRGMHSQSACSLLVPYKHWQFKGGRLSGLCAKSFSLISRILFVHCALKGRKWRNYGSCEREEHGHTNLWPGANGNNHCCNSRTN